MSNSQKISVIIRTYNEQEYLGKLINVLYEQTGIDTELQIIVVDSGSTDRTCDTAREHGVEIIETAKEDFNYSRNLNLGIEASFGDLIVIISAHAIPTDKFWLKTIISCFLDSNVAGVFCRQIPWQDADPYEIIRLRKTFDEKPRKFGKDDAGKNVNFSNAASCIRKQVWQKHNFVIMPASEDMEWGKWVLANGYKLVYTPDAKVFHSHNESCLREVRRIIELEKTEDIQRPGRRTIFLTFKQAVGILLKRGRIICTAEEYATVRGRQLFKCLIKSMLYLIEFNR